MIDLFSLFAIGITAFIASNIDDTFVLILLFSTPNIQARHVVIGQFLGMGLFVAIGVLGSLIALVVPLFVIGLLGLIPIGIGIKGLWELREHNDTTAENIRVNKRTYFSFLTVAAVTVSNGGDDIGVFTPLFAKYNTISEVTILVTIFMLMTGVWCALTYYLVNHPFLATRIRRTGQILSPFALIALGIYLFADALFF